MVFSSNVFLLYFMPVFFAVYFLTPRKARNYVLLFASFLFYAFGAPEFILLLILSTVANFFLVRWMVAVKKKENNSLSPRRFPLSKLICGHYVARSIGLLFNFK